MNSGMGGIRLYPSLCNRLKSVHFSNKISLETTSTDVQHLEFSQIELLYNQMLSKPLTQEQTFDNVRAN